jgi:hypothetical protein
VGVADDDEAVVQDLAQLIAGEHVEPLVQAQAELITRLTAG